MSDASILVQPLTALRGVGPDLARKLAGLDLKQVEDLLFHLPLRYEDRRQITPLAALQDGGEYLVRGQVEHAQVKFGGRRSLLVTIRDDGGLLRMRLFHFNQRQQQAFVSGAWIRCFGTARMATGGLEMVHPEYRIADSAAALPVEASLTPIYPLTAGITQTRMRRLVEMALDQALADDDLRMPLPGFDEPDSLQALKQIHRPPQNANLQALLDGRYPARQRLIREELLAHQLCMRVLRRQVRGRRAPQVSDFPTAMTALGAQLGFRLTGAQQRVCEEISADMGHARPMMRLVQGDVGSGKTVVAAAALLATVRSGWQAVLMAPTDLLAEQHARTLSLWLAPLKISVAFLSGKHKAAGRKDTLAAIESGAAELVVGTHAVFQTAVQFKRLALVVIDEQHRFGVQQRLSLRDKGPQGQGVHQLVMTATPIPRTLAQTSYADLDLSVIDELPPGRKPVTTAAISNERRGEVLARIGAACRQGRQAYWVCTLIEANDQLEAQAAEETEQLLRSELPDLKIGLVHGRLKAAEKAERMAAFKAGELQLLVATTVIEVGVDVPNASIMIIDNAERLGLSQLHQLRGRVGRGAAESQCLLLYRPPLGDAARARLAVMRETQDGFLIAQRDLELRGPGEILGRRQTGVVGLKVADPIRDAPLIPDLQRLADRWLVDHPRAAGQLVRRWVGDLERYGQV